MSDIYTDYHEAYEQARQLADRCRHDVALRKVREYGRTRYAVSLACVNDSDYARAEIVRPGMPQVRRGRS